MAPGNEKKELYNAVIQAVSNKPELWNPIHPAYKNSTHRSLVWQEVIKSLHETSPQLFDEYDVHKVKKVWELLRDTYIRTKSF